MNNDIFTNLRKFLKLDTLSDNIIDGILTYLDKYGYIKRDGVITPEEVWTAIKLLYQFGGLENRNFSIERTVKLMQQSRCGCLDVQAARATIAKWNRQNLEYCIVGWVGDGISKEEQKEIVAQSFKSWSDVCNLSFKETNSQSNANIVLDVGSGRRSGFDGPSGTLAYAYLPNGTDEQLLLMWDLDEIWVGLSNNQRGIKLLNVTTHEAGHLLGLEHSKNQSALMAPYYNDSIYKPMPNDDIPRIQSLYGQPTEIKPSPVSPNSNSKSTISIDWDKKSFEIPGYRISKI